jgi:hypothetical protein
MSGRRNAVRTVPGLLELARAQHGVVRRTQLAALGVDSKHVAHQVAAGRWRELSPTVVALTTGWLTVEQLRWRAVLHPSGPAWLTGIGALVAEGLTRWQRPTELVLVAHGHRPPPLPGAHYVSSRRLPAPCAGAGRLPMTSRTRSVLEAVRTEPHPRTAAGLVLATVQQRLVTAAQLRAEAAAHPRLRHRAAVVAAIDDAALGADALSEADVLALVRAAGLPPPRRQAPGRDGLGRRRRRDLEVDLADGTVLVLQVDGTLHLDVLSVWHDQVDDAGVAAEGRVVLRVPAALARIEPDQVVAQLVRIRLGAEQRASR